MQKTNTNRNNKKSPLHMEMDDKNSVLQFELNNFDKIVCFKSSGFWVATEHSCLFLNKIIGIDAKIHVTYDKYIKKDRIYSSFHSGYFAATRQAILDKGCKIIRDGEKIILFQMPESCPPEQLKAWLRDEEMKKQKLDAYFLPDSGETKLYSLIRKLGRETLISGNHMRQNVRGIVADRMFELCLDMMREYMKINKKTSINEEKLIRAKIMSLVGDFSFIAVVAHDEDLLDDRKMMRIGVITKDICRTLGICDNDNCKKSCA